MWSYGRLKLQDVNFWGEIFAFFRKTTPYGQIFKIMFQTFSSPHRSTCCVQISPTGNGWNRALLTWQKYFAWFSSSRYSADRAQNLPGPAPKNVLRVLQISTKSVHFWRSYIWTCEHCQNESKVNPIFGWSLASSWITRADADKYFYSKVLVWVP